MVGCGAASQYPPLEDRCANLLQLPGKNFAMPRLRLQRRHMRVVRAMRILPSNSIALKDRCLLLASPLLIRASGSKRTSPSNPDMQMQVKSQVDAGGNNPLYR
jgi:hypothetical protein